MFYSSSGFVSDEYVNETSVEKVFSSTNLKTINGNPFLVIGAVFWAYAFFVFVSPKPRCKCDTKLHGKTIVITGGTDGVGKATAFELAKRGAKLILPCRNMSKGQAVADEIKRESGNPEVLITYVDFEKLRTVEKCVKQIKNKVNSIDVLINNAGIGHGIGMTQDGFPRIFGVNHLGPFLLTTGLMELLRKSSSPRIIFVSSVAHLWGKINFSLLDKVDGSWVPAQFHAYARSKLANVLFAREINRREEKISTFVAHPVGAQTQIHLALASNLEKQSGEYFVSCRPSKTCRAALDHQLAADLWSYSERAITSTLTSAKEGSCVSM